MAAVGRQLPDARLPDIGQNVTVPMIHKLPRTSALRHLDDGAGSATAGQAHPFPTLLECGLPIASWPKFLLHLQAHQQTIEAMIFQREGCKPMLKPTAEKLAIEVARIKSSFASLTADDGSYLQIAGGPGLFMLELHDARGNQSRGFQDEPVAIHPDGTILMFSAGRIPMARADWFLLRQIAETLTAFLEGRDFPEYLRWRSAA